MTEEEPAPADDLAALVARAQAAQQAGISPARIRLQLVQDGADPDQADLIVDQVYNNNDAPLSERYRESSHRAAAQVTAGDRAESWSWMIWAGGLLAVNALSYAFGWGFWIW